MIDAGTADAFRYIYAVLAMLTCCGFTMTLVLRWDVLHLGEKLLRAGLVAEHAIIIYGAYVALEHDLPPNLVGALLTASLVVVVLGFVVWIGDMLLGGDRDVKRLTDQ